MGRQSRVVPFELSLGFLRDNLASTGRTSKQVLSFGTDAALVAFCVWAAYSLRLSVVYTDWRNILWLLVLVPPFTVVVFAGLGIYRWVIRASSPRQFEQLLSGVVASSVFLLILQAILPVRFAPRSVFLIYGLLLLTSTIGVRALWARWHSHGAHLGGKPVAVYGAGAAGRQLVQLMKYGRDFHPEFFIDDNPALQGRSVGGLRVLSADAAGLKTAVRRHAIEEIILAMPSVRGEPARRILQRIEKLGLPVKTMPSVQEIISGKRAPDELRAIRLEDLLGRAPVQAIPSLLGVTIAGKSVLVSGAGGSIGSELCRQALQLKPSRLIILDVSEFALYQIHQELQREAANSGGTEIVPVLATVLDDARLQRIFDRWRPDSVFHAAAYKHVPLVEENPFEGLRTNVFGTLNMAKAAAAAGASVFILISTDKAVRPTNVMGASKRLAERVVQDLAQEPANTGTAFSMVRFGNVLGSSGSVVPLFTDQILAGGPVTVTHSEVTRFFMTIPEAVSLVIQAAALADNGQVFMLDMGEPVKIVDLAKALINLHAQNTGEDPATIKIRFTGLRSGEKLYEELLVSEDDVFSTAHPKIFRAREVSVLKACAGSEWLGELSDIIYREDIKAARSLLCRLVEGYGAPSTPQDEMLTLDSSAR